MVLIHGKKFGDEKLTMHYGVSVDNNDARP
jgi:hypothetical protein